MGVAAVVGWEVVVCAGMTVVRVCVGGGTWYSTVDMTARWACKHQLVPAIRLCVHVRAAVGMGLQYNSKGGRKWGLRVKASIYGIIHTL